MVEGLVVARSGQQVFRPAARDYPTRVIYEHGWTRSIQLPRYGKVEVVVDPWLNGASPPAPSAASASRTSSAVGFMPSRLPRNQPRNLVDLTP